MLMAIFDKSFVHSINADEAAVFDMHFMSNITPLFFVEVLADLEKGDLKSDEERTALVRTLAAKTPSFRSYPNIPHAEIVLHELLGDDVEIRGVPLVGGGRRVQSAEGLGTVFEEPPEMRATNRWKDGEFGEDEYAAARSWREMLRRAPEGFVGFVGDNPGRLSFRDLAAVKRMADRLLDRDGYRRRTLRTMLSALGIPPHLHGRIVARWKTAGGPRMADFAPYATHVLTVDLFRVMAMASGHIDPDKTSNYADMAYLYYLPFCEVFISSDKLHRRCVPLFLTGNQQFIWGHELRPELARLVDRYLQDPDLPERGLIGVADKHIMQDDAYFGPLYQKVHPGHRPPAPGPKLSPEAEKALVERLKAAAESPPPEAGADLSGDDQTTTFIRKVPVRRGRFQMMPKGAEKGT